MSQSLDGQSILVTGASGGIGAAIVERLASEGARPIIHYGRDRDGAEALLSRIGGHGFIVQADLSAPEGAFHLWQKTVDAAGRVHGVINNAGIRTEISIEAISGRLESRLAEGIPGEFLRSGRPLQGGDPAFQGNKAAAGSSTWPAAPDSAVTRPTRCPMARPRPR
jgi:NAD(P)-dependent dehydrogenase (short-subunit alcohol dehydrogenase family)